MWQVKQRPYARADHGIGRRKRTPAIRRNARHRWAAHRAQSQMHRRAFDPPLVDHPDGRTCSQRHVRAGLYRQCCKAGWPVAAPCRTMHFHGQFGCQCFADPSGQCGGDGNVFGAASSARHPALLHRHLMVSRRVKTADGDMCRQLPARRIACFAAGRHGIISRVCGQQRQRCPFTPPDLPLRHTSASIGIDDVEQWLDCLPPARRRQHASLHHRRTARWCPAAQHIPRHVRHAHRSRIRHHFKAERWDAVAKWRQVHFLKHHIGYAAIGGAMRHPLRRRDQRIDRLIFPAQMHAKAGGGFEIPGGPAQNIALRPYPADGEDCARRQCNGKGCAITICRGGWPPLAVALLGAALHQVGRPNHRARHPHRAIKAGNAAAIA